MTVFVAIIYGNYVIQTNRLDLRYETQYKPQYLSQTGQQNTISAKSFVLIAVTFRSIPRSAFEVYSVYKLSLFVPSLDLVIIPTYPHRLQLTANTESTGISPTGSIFCFLHRLKTTKTNRKNENENKKPKWSRQLAAECSR